MAEKYGEVPPRFTKAWWEYFWYYYKWRVICIGIAVLLAAVTVVQCATRKKYDLDIVYAGHKVYSEEMGARLTDALTEYISDVDGNGEKAIFFQQLTFYDNNGTEEMDSAMQTKLDLTFVDDCCFLYLMDREQAEIYINRESSDGLFADVSDYADEDADVLLSSDGHGYAVNLENSRILKENNIYCEDLYLLVRVNGKDDEKNTRAYEDSVNIAKILVQQ